MVDRVNKISIGLVAICFAPLMLNTIKDGYSIFCALIALGLCAFSKKIVIHKYHLIMVLPIVCSLIFGVKLGEPFLNIVSYKIYSFLPCFLILSYIIFAGSLENASGLKTLSVLACIISIFCIIQNFNPHMCKIAAYNPNSINTPAYKVIGTFLSPIFCSMFLAMCVPVMLKFKHYIPCIIAIIAILLMKSDMAIGSTALGLICLLGMRKKRYLGVILIGLVCCLAAVMVIRPKIDGGARFDQWQKIYEESNSPLVLFNKKGEAKVIKYKLFGRGLGSFKYTYHKRNENGFLYAHNEYLQVLFEMGRFGVVVFIGFIAWILFKIKDDFLRAGLIIGCLLSLGTFTWQFGATQFLTAYFIGIDRHIKKG